MLTSTLKSTEFFVMNDRYNDLLLNIERGKGGCKIHDTREWPVCEDGSCAVIIELIDDIRELQFVNINIERSN